MPELKEGLTLISGEAGLDRNIRWIYFADCIQCVKGKQNPADFIHGEEIVIITNVSLTEHDDVVLSLIQAMNQKNIAAVVINHGQISQQVSEYCEQIHLPLFELSENLHLIDLSQIVCRELMQEENTVSSRERLFSEILNMDEINKEEILAQASYLGVSLSGPFFVVVFHLYSRKDEKDPFPSRQLSVETAALKASVKTAFRPYVPKHMLVMDQMDNVLALVPWKMLNRELLSSVIDQICKTHTSHFNRIVRAGIGLPYEYLEDFRISYKEAKDALQIHRLFPDDKTDIYYESLGIYSVIMQIHNGRFMDEYIDSHLGPLIAADQVQEGNLLHTLEVYLACNANANDAAEKLFLHRNTMHYRINKIRKILNNNLTDLSTYLELELAFAFYRFRKQ